MTVAIHHCPICGYDALNEPPYNKYGHGSYEICSSCGTEFGVDEFDSFDDYETTVKKLRQTWIDEGMKWWSDSTPPPDGWNPKKQLKNLTGFKIPN